MQYSTSYDLLSMRRLNLVYFSLCESTVCPIGFFCREPSHIPTNLRTTLTARFLFYFNRLSLRFTPQYVWSGHHDKKTRGRYVYRPHNHRPLHPDDDDDDDCILIHPTVNVIHTYIILLFNYIFRLETKQFIFP